MAWAQAYGIRHILIQPGRPMQNGYIESFNGKFRDEHLNKAWFGTLDEDRAALGIWRARTTTRSALTAAWDASSRRDSPSCIASTLAMQLVPHQPPRRSINLATPDFLNSVGTSVGGRSHQRRRSIVRPAKSTETVEFFNVLTRPELSGLAVVSHDVVPIKSETRSGRAVGSS